MDTNRKPHLFEISVMKASIWAIFLLTLLKGISLSADGVTTSTFFFRTANYLSYLPQAVLVIMGLVVMLKFKKLNFRAFDVFLINSFICWSFISLMTGAVFGSIFSLQKGILELIPLISITVCFLNDFRFSILKHIKKALLFQFIIAGGFACYVLMAFPIRFRGLDVETIHVFGFNLIFPVVLLLPSSLTFKVSSKILYTFSYVAISFYLLNFQLRAGIVCFFIINPLLLLYYIRNSAHSRTPRRYIRQLIFMIMLIIIFTISIFINEQLSFQITESWNGIISRITRSREDLTITKAAFVRMIDYEVKKSRGAEIASVIKQSTLRTWMLGEGFGSFWISDFWGGIPWRMVHFGPLYLVIKGGIVYSLLFLLLVYRAMIGNKGKIRDPIYFGSLIYVVNMFIHFLSQGIFYIGYSSLLFWMCLGYLLANKERVPQGKR